jgi:hypothetical protein
VKTLILTTIISTAIIGITIVLVIPTQQKPQCQEGVLPNGTCAGPIAINNTASLAESVPNPVQLIQMTYSNKELYILWSGYDPSSHNTDILLSVSDNNGSSFQRVTDLRSFGISSVNQMKILDGNIYLVSGNTITKSNDDGKSFGAPVVLNGNGISSISDVIPSENNVYAVFDNVINSGNSFEILSSASSDSGSTFSKPIKLFGMPECSEDYSQVASSGSNIYVVAEGKYGGPQGPVGVLFKKSADGGATFGNTTDLAGDNSVDFAPKIASSEKNVYVVWSKLGNKGGELYIRSSQDYGQTFGPSVKLSIDPDSGISDSDFPKIITGDNDTVYVVWWGVHFSQNNTETDSLLFRKSDDAGKTFGDVIKLSGDKTSPTDIGHDIAVASSGKNVYATWSAYENIQSVSHVGVFFTKSNDGGNTFSDLVNINSEESGAQNLQVSAFANNVYVAWDTGHSDHEISVEKSSDRGTTFAKVTGFESALSETNIQRIINQNSSSTTYTTPEFRLGTDPFPGIMPHRLVFFMKSNSTAEIFVRYTSSESNAGTMNIGAGVYVGKTNYTPLDTSDVTISGDPTSIPITQGSDTTVVYTITAKEGIKGVYWLSISQICGVMPVAIGIDSSSLNPSDIPVPMGAMHCPVQFLDAQILGISGGTAEYKLGQAIQY